jgi:threonine/homoserine/homoserine lactone efflux protein
MTLGGILLFAATELLLSITPGPAVFLVVSQGMRGGFRTAARGAAGILSGNAIYFAASAAGLRALLMASQRVFRHSRMGWRASASSGPSTSVGARGTSAAPAIATRAG